MTKNGQNMAAPTQIIDDIMVKRFWPKFKNLRQDFQHFGWNPDHFGKILEHCVRNLKHFGQNLKIFDRFLESLGQNP